MSNVAIFWIVVVALYFLPSVIAILRGHHQAIAITMLNLLLGWTALGWIAALVWSVTAKQQVTQLIVANTLDGTQWEQPMPARRRSGLPAGSVLALLIIAAMFFMAFFAR
jgi:hypothetical protein